MTPEHIAMLIAAPIIVLIILWAPLLDFIDPPWRFLQSRREEEASNEVPFSVEIPNALPEQLLDCSALAEESMCASNVKDLISDLDPEVSKIYFDAKDVLVNATE